MMFPNRSGVRKKNLLSLFPSPPHGICLAPVNEKLVGTRSTASLTSPSQKEMDFRDDVEVVPTNVFGTR